MNDGWIPFSQVNWADNNVKQFHVDTRDFCVNVECQPEQRVQMPDLEKYYSRFVFKASEVSELIKRYYEESGGEREWRFFMLEKNDSWDMKYIRIYRIDDGNLVVCNKDNYALNKDILGSKAKRSEYEE